jgi:hypothetical protein
VEATRRELFKFGGLGALGAFGVGLLPWGGGLGAARTAALPPALRPEPFRSSFMRPPVLRPFKSVRDSDGIWTDHFEVTQKAGRAELAPG